MDLNFGKAVSYQEKLDQVTQEWGITVRELIKLRRELIPKRSALIISAKNGIEITDDKGVKKIYKPSNKEEREALIAHLLSEEVAQEQNLEDTIKYLDGASKNLRQLLSSEQSRMRMDTTIAEGINFNQI